jgi:hypothetical protein
MSAATTPSHARKSSGTAATPTPATPAAAAAASPPTVGSSAAQPTSAPKKRPTAGKGKKEVVTEPIDPDETQPGVVRAKMRVDLEVSLRPFLPAEYPASTRAFDHRVVFDVPNPTGHEDAGQPVPPAQTITPATGVWEPVAPVDGAPVKWSRVYDIRLDRAALLPWEHLHLPFHIEERSLPIPSQKPMFHPDGRCMSPAEAEIALKEQLALETGGRSKRKGSAGGTAGAASPRASAAEKEAAKEKERAKKKKEKEKADRIKKGLPPTDMEESDRPSRAHPLLEEEDVPWVRKQTTQVHLSPLLFAPFAVSRTIAQSVDAKLCPTEGLLSYTIRISVDKDIMPPEVRKELNPMCLTLKRIENLPRDPLPTYEQMQRTYKSVSARCEFFSPGTTETLRPDTPAAQKVPPGLSGRELKEATAAAERAKAEALTQPPIPPIVRATPSAVLETIPQPHASTLHFATDRIIYLGLYSRAHLASSIQSSRLKIILRDRDHVNSWTPDEVERERKEIREREAEVARLQAEETALAAKKKGRKGNSSSRANGSDSARGKATKPGSAKGKRPEEEKEIEAPPAEPNEDTNLAAPPSSLSHLDFRASSTSSLLASAVLRAQAASKLPRVRPVVLPVERYEQVQNVCGVAEFDLADLFRASTTFSLVSPVKPVYPPSHIKLIPPQTKRDPYGGQAGRGQETLVYLDVRLSFPYTQSGPLLHETYHRFSRCVVAFSYNDSILYQKLLSALAEVNTKALGLVVPGGGRWGGTTSRDGSGAPSPPQSDASDTSVSLMSLSSIRLTPAQMQADSTVDVVCGVQVMDDHQRIFLLEGISSHHGGRSFDIILDRLGRERENTPWNTKDFFRFLSNREVTFADRLYACFHAAPKNIRLKTGTTLQSLAKKNSFYVLNGSKGGATEETFQAFRDLVELMSAPNLRLAMRASLFPTPLHLASLEKYFGSFISDLDLLGSVPGLVERDRYDPVKKNHQKVLPAADTPDGYPEITRPRSRGAQRNKEQLRSFELDLKRMKKEKRDAKREVEEQERQQKQMFDELSREVAEQNNTMHRYEHASGEEEFQRTQLLRTQELNQGLNSPNSQSSLSQRGGSHSTGRLSDAEVLAERATGFVRKDVVARKRTMEGAQDNEAYLRAKEEMKRRAANAQFIRSNIAAVHDASEAIASTKAPSDYPRYLQPSDLGLTEFHVYASQAKNVYALQQKMMRDQIKAAEAATGEEHHYTYNADYLSASFEKFDLTEETMKAELREKAKWKTAYGFRLPAHKTHAQSYHPTKDLHPATVEALNMPPEERADLARLLDQKAAVSTANALHSHPFSAFPKQNEQFGWVDSENIDAPLGDIGDAAEELIRQKRLAEHALWKSKLLASPLIKQHWAGSGQVGHTNAPVPGSGPPQPYTGVSAPLPAQPTRTDMVKNMLKDPPARPGLKFSKNVLDENGKLVFTKKNPVPNVPVSMHALSPFVDHNRTMHMRTLDEKERSELDDSPRNPRPRFAVSGAPISNTHIHRRPISDASLAPPTKYGGAEVLTLPAVPTAASS